MHHSSGLLPSSQNVLVSHCACLFWQLLCALPSLPHQATALSFTPGGRTLLVVYSDHTVCGCGSACAYVSGCVCASVCVYVQVCVCAHLGVGAHVCMHVYVCVCFCV